MKQNVKNKQNFIFCFRKKILYLHQIWQLMSVIYMLISISTIVVGLFLFLYLRAIRSGQYEDVESPAIRMLFEDELVPPAQEEDKIDTSYHKDKKEKQTTT